MALQVIESSKACSDRSVRLKFSAMYGALKKIIVVVNMALEFSESIMSQIDFLRKERLSAA